MRFGVIQFPGSCDERDALSAASRDGGLVLGICNGFQVLCEAGLLPGALLPNTSLRFQCRQVEVEVVNADTRWTAACERGDQLSIPAKHQTGRYWAPEPVLDELEANGQVVLRYATGNGFNGAARDIAGVCNAAGNVVGLMPHPEHAVDPLTGSADGLRLFESLALPARACGRRHRPLRQLDRGGDGGGRDLLRVRL